MEAYWNNPEETQQAFWEGWLQTGDIASMSKDGYIKILDRKKEMINVSGFNDHIVYICLRGLTDLLFQTCLDHALICCAGVF